MIRHFLEHIEPGCQHFRILSHTGPLILVDGQPQDDEELLMAARIASRFSSGRDADLVTVEINTPAGQRTIELKPFAVADVQKEWYL